ncbi:MAG: amidohydrolase family protein [Armatimonadetes bacterium]|nr:amidohydrolase family protein [Armatimonadota bacterium]
MPNLIEIKDVDRRFYESRLRDWLPEKLIDIHTHVWRDGDYLPGTPPRGQERAVTWPSRVAKDNPIEDLQETYRLMLPGKRVTPLIFPMIPQAGNLERVNGYVAECSRRCGVPALIFSDPAWSAAQLEESIRAGGFLGAKSYLTLAPAYIPAREIRIFDFFPRHHLKVLDRRGWIVILHIPRDGRLRDPLNLAQLLEIERDYPNLRLIIAHVGRAYCNEDVGNAFEVLAGTSRMVFDFSANTNDFVFERLLGCVGPKRVLFGTDMPILRMRMRRICEAGRYVNIVPKGLYGDVSDDKNMAEAEGEEAEALSFFLYEELNAFRRAADRAGLSRADLEDVFFNNARQLVIGAGGSVDSHE